MSVRVRPFRNGGMEVDISVLLPDGTRYRERKVHKKSKSMAQRWGESRERFILTHGRPAPKKEVPTLQAFATRFLKEYAVANRQKPSGVAAKKTIFRVHLLPVLGRLTLNAITDSEVQRLKAGLCTKAPKTVNNVLTVLNTALKTAQAWGLIAHVPCAIRLVPVPRPKAACHDFKEFERLVQMAEQDDRTTALVILLGGEAGLRCGEIIALQWQDVDLENGRLCVQRSSWNGIVTTPKSGQLRYVPMTTRLAAILRLHWHPRNPLVLCNGAGQPLTRQQVQYRVARVARKANVAVGVHVLRHTFCSHLAMRGAPVGTIQALAGHQDLSVTQRYMHHTRSTLESAIALLNGPGYARGGGDSSETAPGN